MMNEHYNLLDTQTHKAYVLHRRPFRETSALVKFWVESLGLITAVVKGVYGAGSKTAQRNAWLQPFTPLEVSISGRHDLKNVYEFEPLATNQLLTGTSLMAGVYLNELLVYILSKHECELYLFKTYAQLIDQLLVMRESSATGLARTLRVFELDLLESIGLGVNWFECEKGVAIQAGQMYLFLPGAGFQQNALGQMKGDIIKAIALESWDKPGALATLRQVLRQQLEWVAGRSLRAPSLQGKHESG